MAEDRKRELSPDSLIRILHLEDSVDDAELIYRELRRSATAFTAHRVETEAAFRAALASDPPDIILADYLLPSFNGLAALAISREMAPDIPFIFVSGSLGEERAIEALREGATDYIIKDRPGRLTSAVQRALLEFEERRARTRAEKAVIESEQRFRYAASATRDVIWDHDVIAGTVYVNDAMRSKWGHRDSAASVSAWGERIHPEDRARVLDSYERWLQSGGDERWTAEFRFQRGDGTYGYAVQRSLVLRDPAGHALRVIGAMQDVTETRRMQEQIDRTERIESLGRVAATIAHEFNNVLMGIQPIGELILLQSNDEQLGKLGRRIVESVGRGRRVVDEILRMSRVPDPVSEEFDLAALLQDMRLELQGVAGPRVELVVEPPRGPTFIRCDRGHLQQVVVNLVANARDAMPSGGRLTLSAAAEGERVVLSVADTGTGMTEDVAAHIFEPLFTTKKMGTGLGLAVSYQLLRQNDATIVVDSAPGEGTTFRIAFRPAAAGSGRREEEWSPREAVAAKRILLVEDNLNVAEGVRMLLESQGFETHVVEQGGDVQDAVESWLPDVVLLDMSLPDMSGAEVFDQLVTRHPDLPVILTSGHIDGHGVGDRARKPNSVFLRKPFDLESLLKSIDQVIRPLAGRRSREGPKVVTANG